MSIVTASYIWANMKLMSKQNKIDFSTVSGKYVDKCTYPWTITDNIQEEGNVKILVM